MNCFNCYYANHSDVDPNTLKKQIVCQRYPPKPLYIFSPQGGQIIAIWPPVVETGFCGEWRQDDKREPTLKTSLI